MRTADMQRGTLVAATKALDPVGCNVPAGTLGVVFEETNFHGDNGGPMVRWFTGGMCNVYEGQVRLAVDDDIILMIQPPSNP